ncbi:MAG: 4-oxalocrotonate tautomerase [Blastococcus sp.]|jgi:4-oxalocrotonate tautomerase|nr:4-oxalocrotonate tautomerase [Blastococcus sp.]
MPFVSVKVIEGVFDESRKRQIVEQVTEAMVRVEGEAMRPVTWVVVEEVRSGDWGIGGRAMTTEDVLALAGSAPVG